jgi:REP-associated tyrosine transposase
LVYHLVWSVKDREPLLEKAFQQSLHEKIRHTIQEKGGKLHAIGNVYDHIHLLVECPSKVATADLVNCIKTTSAHFIKAQNPKLRNFGWQEGYGVFSVGYPGFVPAKIYVNNQEDHHKVQSFEEEWQHFLKALSYA